VQEIKRFDFIIHPFFHLDEPKEARRKIHENEWREIEAGWYKQIDEIAKDSTRTLIIVPTSVNESSLERYALEKLGNRVFFKMGDAYFDSRMERYRTLPDALKSNKFSFNHNKIKTRGFGEFTLGCVLAHTIIINHDLGMENPVPYRNPQSNILPKKSIADGIEYYPTPSERRELMELMKKSPAEAKARVQMVMREYSKNRRRKTENITFQAIGRMFRCHPNQQRRRP